MIERVVLALGLILLAVLAYRLVNGVLLRRRSGTAIGLPGYRLGYAAILYFTTPTCQPCLTLQRPALERLRQMVGPDLQVIQIDASRQPDLADAWGVLAVPTTFLIDSRGRPRGVNHGVASDAKLLGQLHAIGVTVAETPRQAGHPAQAQE